MSCNMKLLLIFAMWFCNCYPLAFKLFNHFAFKQFTSLLWKQTFCKLFSAVAEKDPGNKLCFNKTFLTALIYPLESSARHYILLHLFLCFILSSWWWMVWKKEEVKLNSWKKRKKKENHNIKEFSHSIFDHKQNKL